MDFSRKISGTDWVGCFCSSVALVLLCLVAYSRAFGSDLVFDSYFIVGEDIRLKYFGAKSIYDIFAENYWWPSIYSSLYRPLTTLAFAIQYSVLGFELRPAGYQMVNLMLHSVVVAASYRLLLKMGMRPFFAFLASAWFALHPYGTEVVPNIVGLSDILALLSVVTGMHIYLDVLEGRKTFARGSVQFLFVAVGGLLSKENAISLLALIFWHACTLGRGRVVELYRSGYFTKRRYGVIAGVLMVALAAVVVPKIFHRDLDLAVSQEGDPVTVDNPLRSLSSVAARVNALSILGSNITNCVVPTTISADYSFGQIELGNLPPVTENDWRVVGMAVGVLLFGLSGLLVYDRWKAYSFSVGSVFALAMPTANILLLIGTIRADRLVYAYILPVVVCAGLVVYTGYQKLKLSPRFDLLVRKGAIASVVVFMLMLGVITNLRATEWRTAKAFWRAAYATSPGSFKTKLGWGAADKGEDSIELLNADVALMREAIEQLAASNLPMVKDHDQALESLAQRLLDRARLLIKGGDERVAAEDISEAEVLLEKVLVAKKEKSQLLEDLKERGVRSLDGRNIKSDSILISLSEIRRYRGQYAAAVELLETHLASNHLTPKYLKYLARAKVDAGDWEAGVHYLLQVLLLKPDDKASSREVNWILRNHQLPSYAKAYASSDDSARSREEGVLLNVDDPLVAKYAKDAVRALVRVLEEEGMDREKAILMRSVRVELDQPRWLE